MRIKVLINWGGVASDFRRVLPGEYDLDDPALWGAGQSILDEGNAVIVDHTPAPPPVETVEDVNLPGEQEPEPPKPKIKGKG